MHYKAKCPYDIQVNYGFKSILNVYFLYYIATANFKWYLDQFREASTEINATVDEHGFHLFLTGM